MGLADKLEKMEDSAPTEAGPATVTPAATSAPASASTAVATQRSTGVAVAASGPDADFVGSVKNAMVVEYNTLAQIKATNGNFVERETNTILGDTITFELISWQDSYTVSANDDKAPKESVRFSDDGVYLKDGTPVDEYIAELKADGWARAGKKQRAVVVGGIQQAAKSANFNGMPVQFDLSPESRNLWVRYQALSAYGQRAGKLTAEKVKNVKATTRLVTKGSNTYTVVDFVPQ